MKSSRALALNMRNPSGNVLIRSPLAISNPSASASTLTQRSRAVSYAMTSSFVRPQAPGTATEANALSEIQQGLQIEGNVNILGQMLHEQRKQKFCVIQKLQNRMKILFGNTFIVNNSRTDDSRFDYNSTYLEGSQEILCITYTEQCEMLAAGLSDGTVRMFKVDSGQYVTALRDAEMRQNPGPTTAIKHRPVHKSHPITQTLTATYVTGCVKCWHYPTGQCLYTIREKRQTLGLGYHPFLPKFVTVGDDTNIYLYDEETKIQERIFHASNSPDIMNGHTSRVFCSCFNPKSAHELISGGWDDTVQFWDTRQPYATRRIAGVHMCGDGIDISKNGKEILTCAWQRTNPLQLWDYGSGKLMVTIEPDIFNSQLYCGKYINNLFVVCGGSGVNLMRVVDLRSHTSVALVRNLPGAVFDMDISSQIVKHPKRSKINDIPPLPRMVFCSGKKIYEIDIG